MKKFLFWILVLAFLQTGCGTVIRTIEPEAILPTPKERIPIPSAYVSNGAVNCVLSAVTVDGSIPAEMEQFSQAMYCAYTMTDASSTEWIRRFVEKGIGLSDQTCGLFFDSLEKRRVDTSYYQTNMNVAGTAVTAILVGAGHNARSAFNVATALAFGNAWFENYKANYVFTPQLGKLHMKLKTDVRKPIGNEMKRLASLNQYASFDQAKLDLQSYDELCSHKSIIYLLEDVLSAAKIETFNAEVTQSDKDQADVLAANLYSLAEGSGATGAFSDMELQMLYVVATTQGTELRKLVAIFISSTDHRMERYIQKLKLDKDVPDATGVATILSIGQFLRYGNSAAVRQYRSLASKAIEVKQAAATSSLATGANITDKGRAQPSVTATAGEIASWQAVKVQPLVASGRGVNFNFRAVRPVGQ